MVSAGGEGVRGVRLTPSKLTQLKSKTSKNLDPRQVSALVSGSSSLGLSPGQGHHFVFLGNILYFQSASLHSGV